MKTRFVWLAVFCFILLLSIPVAAKDNWIGIRSKNFNLIGNADEKDIRAAAARLEQFRDVFSQLFPGVNFSNSIPTNVVVFRNGSSYNAFRPKTYKGKPATDVTGYFQSDTDVNYITVIAEGEKKDTYELIFHNYVHYMMDSVFGKIDVPPWLTEGLAEYYQTLQIKDSQKATLGIAPEYDQWVMQNSRLQPFRSFVGITNYSISKSGGVHSNSFYGSQAWGLVHFLLDDKNGANRAAVGKFISLLAKKVSQEQAFKEAFGYDYMSAEQGLEKYIAKNVYSSMPVTLGNKPVFDTGAAAVPVSDAEANSYLGELLYQSNETADAEKYLRIALGIDANSARANVSLGLLKAKLHSYAEAQTYAEKAIAAAKDDPYVYYSYAYILSRGSTDEFNYVTKYPADKTEKMKAALKKAIGLNPDFAESYRLLSFIYMVNEEDPDEALAYIKKGGELQPGNPEFSLLLAQIYSQKNKFAEAKRIAQNLVETADELNMRNRADFTLKNIEQREKYKTLSDNDRKEFDDTIAKLRQPRKEKYVTEDEIARIQSEAPNNSMNKLLEPLKDGEKRAVGYFQKIACAGTDITYTFKTGTESLTLHSKGFSKLQLLALVPEAEDLAFGCAAKVENMMAVINYMPGKAAAAGTLATIAFVPKTFRLRTEEELAKADEIAYSEREVVPKVIIKERSAEDEAQAKADAERRQAEYEAQIKESKMKQVRQSLRKPQENEKQVLATLEKIECIKDKIIFSARTGGQLLKYRASTFDSVILKMLTNEYSNINLSCGSAPPPMLAVLTFVPDNAAKAKENGVLVAVEFVPRTFT